MQNKEIDDIESLLIRISNGDHHAYRQLFDYYKNKVYNYAIRYLKSDELSQEMVQEIFLKIWTHRSKLRNIENFGGYLRRVSMNMTMDVLKKIATSQRAIDISNKDWTESDPSTENYLMHKDSEAYVDLLLDQLTKQQKLIYTMCHIEGLKHKEVAEKLNISPFTVKAHLREAVKKLRTMIGENRTSILSLVFLGLIK